METTSFLALVSLVILACYVRPTSMSAALILARMAPRVLILSMDSLALVSLVIRACYVRSTSMSVLPILAKMAQLALIPSTFSAAIGMSPCLSFFLVFV
jgi:hypothetical protein